jgi:uncharacterized GH25 family protein
MLPFAKKGLLFIGVLLAITCLAHEFWLLPNKFIYQLGETANIRFNVGEHFKGDNWTGNKTRINSLVLITPSGSLQDLAQKLSENKGDSLQLALNEPGTHMVLFNSKNSFIKLEAKKFNDYLQEDGLQTAIKYRKEHGEYSLAGTEYYQRSVKTLVQCGIRPDDGSYCTKKTNLPLDIVPATNPYKPQIEGSYINHNRTYHVYFKQQPIPNIKVRYWCKTLDGKLITKEKTTNKRGAVSFNQETGETMISCVHMERIVDDATPEWQSYWGSLTFLYRQGNLFKKAR